MGIMTSASGRRMALGAGVVAIAVTGVAGLASSALFTDNDVVSGSKVATGTIVLDTNPTSTVWKVPNMAPGDVDYSGIDVVNSGSLELRYALTSDSDNADRQGLADKLDAAVVPAAKGADCTKADYATSPIFSGKLSGLFVGDKTTGGQTGDRVLAAGTDEQLCVKLSLNTDADNSFQDATTGTTLTFHSEQTANNA